MSGNQTFLVVARLHRFPPGNGQSLETLCAIGLARCMLFEAPVKKEKGDTFHPDPSTHSELEKMFLRSEGTKPPFCAEFLIAIFGKLFIEKLQEYSRKRGETTVVESLQHLCYETSSKSFDTDHFLGSVLGCYDGYAYPKLYGEAWKDPPNDSVVSDGYHEYIHPMLKQNLQDATL
ncbi:unnamed protein product [Dovyalis caffra]|uniref:Acyl-CoA oxidase C-terminal domain-containing protein n=1 Tax=Dovyalis caffra TaxID=77055 RepID=A0AAV1STJ6_9ROSI|nr:unnamed protein product [Dovyalis caffra]